jgi:hypothetical protein
MQLVLNNQKQYLYWTHNIDTFQNIEVRIFYTMTFVEQIHKFVDTIYVNEDENDVARGFTEWKSWFLQNMHIFEYVKLRD